MDDESTSTVTENDWALEQARTRRLGMMTGVFASVIVPAVVFPAIYLGDTVATGKARYFAIAGWYFLLLLPVDVLIVRTNMGQQRRSDRLVATVLGQLNEAVTQAAEQASVREVQARRQEFERRLSNALDMAEGEPEVIEVIERSFSMTVPASPVELLLADNSHAHLTRMAAVSPTGEPPGCPVDSPDHCPAARRAQIQQFADSDDLDACPKLRGRPSGSVSAACVPVSIMGRTVGVIHATGAVGETMAKDTVEDLATLANLAGARIGLLRVVADTQLQAGTDSLTGLLNRRSLEQRIKAAREQTSTISLAMSDLDQFKLLNDTYGHDAGDRALRLFARVLSESVRADDLVCRYGGEEFVVVLPGCSLEQALPVLESVRTRLDAAVTVAGLPKFTVSFGLTDAEPHEDLATLISRADGALFQAKRDGRDRVVVHANGLPFAAGASGDGRVLGDRSAHPSAAPQAAAPQAG